MMLLTNSKCGAPMIRKSWLAVIGLLTSMLKLEDPIGVIVKQPKSLIIVPSPAAPVDAKIIPTLNSKCSLKEEAHWMLTVPG